jgi:tetratricopeptide (TPR) repeat protein
MQTPAALPSIFLSYSWQEKSAADEIDRDLQQLQLTIIRDVRDLKYRGSISDFMTQIRTTEFCILLIGDSYLKSANCMAEVLHILRERDFQKKLLPVILPSATIYDTKSRLKYTTFWRERKEDLEREISKHAPSSAISAIQDLKIVESIEREINEFLSYIADTKHIGFDELKREGYRTLFNAIGIRDITYLIELLRITVQGDLDRKETLLEEWFEQHEPIAQAFTLRADISKARGNYERAERNYKRALEMDPESPWALNNYGYMLMVLKRDTDYAKSLLRKAVEIQPGFTEARLNLGCLLKEDGERQEAIAQYEYVITDDPTEERAYNNLANVLRGERPFHADTAAKVSSLYERALALKPGYIEALLNYENFLSEFMFDFDKAEKLLGTLIKIDPRSNETVELLRKRLGVLRSRGRPNFGRNELCPCGSGVKYKRCCGAPHE